MLCIDVQPQIDTLWLAMKRRWGARQHESCRNKTSDYKIPYIHSSPETMHFLVSQQACLPVHLQVVSNVPYTFE